MRRLLSSYVSRGEDLESSNEDRQDPTGPVRRHLHRCPGCHLYLEAGDAVCGDCGIADIESVVDRAARLGISPVSAGHHHYAVRFEHGLCCVECGHILAGEDAVPRLATRTSRICSCCGSQIAGRRFCSNCGARIRLFTTALLPDDTRRNLRRMTQLSSYIDRRDPNYKFEIFAPLSHRVALFMMLFIAIECLVLGLCVIINFNLTKQKAFAELEQKYPVEALERSVPTILEARFDNRLPMLWGDPAKACFDAEAREQAGAMIDEWVGEGRSLEPYGVGIDARVLRDFMENLDYSALEQYSRGRLYGEVIDRSISGVVQRIQEDVPEMRRELEKGRRRVLRTGIKPFIYTLPFAVAVGIVVFFLVVKATFIRKAEAHAAGVPPAALDGTWADASWSGEKVGASRFLIGCALVVLAETFTACAFYLERLAIGRATDPSYSLRLGNMSPAFAWGLFISIVLVGLLVVLAWIQYLGKIDQMLRLESCSEYMRRYRVKPDD
jgi:hypothetical protein